MRLPQIKAEIKTIRSSVDLGVRLHRLMKVRAPKENVMLFKKENSLRDAEGSDTEHLDNKYNSKPIKIIKHAMQTQTMRDNGFKKAVIDADESGFLKTMAPLFLKSGTLKSDTEDRCNVGP